MRIFTATLFTALLSAPAFAADLGTYRPGTPYSSSIAPGADVCDNQCAGDAQCRGWNYVKPNPRAQGVCEFLSSVSSPIASQISISGESQSASPISSRVTLGETNTVRVGTAPASQGNTVKVGQSPSTRRVVRQATPQQITPQRASITATENMSLTEQQNRYRQGQVATPLQRQQAAPQQQIQQPRFRAILDAPAPQQAPQRTPRQAYAPQLPVQPNAMQQRHPQNIPAYKQPQQQIQSQRRATGPRRFPAQGQQAPVQRQTAAPAWGTQSGRPAVGQAVPPQPIGYAPQHQAAQPARAAAPQAAPRSTPSQRLAQFTAQTQAQAKSQGQPLAQITAGPIALGPEQARRSLFGRLNDDIKSPEDTPLDMPVATAVPSVPVVQEPLDVLAGGR